MPLKRIHKLTLELTEKTLSFFPEAIGKDKPNIEYHDVTNPNYSKYLRSFEAEARDKANQQTAPTQ